MISTRAGGNGRDRAAPIDASKGDLGFGQCFSQIFEQEKLVKPGDPASGSLGDAIECFGAAGQFNSMIPVRIKIQPSPTV